MAHADVDPAEPPRRRVGAVVLVRDPAGAVLMVKPRYKRGWILPGGGAHEGEPITHAAARELCEETGLVLPLTHLIALDQVPASEDGTSAEGINVVIDGGILTAAQAADVTVPTAAAHELAATAWVPLQHLAAHTEPYQERRIRAAVHATDHGNELPLLLLGERTDRARPKSPE
ncbi:NUDIX hydrolase [Streptomyces sp. N2-109]|uniref:NUDIX hydrolase n=1 Tax=Streptomyces gossypii TaxID=2883101 RepID=A0ABT2K2K9_9ACTN|nr:NUDIX hydrolase [Streptomyces gossypii]MCT2592976.1 NUDIX hydrolase [Streptomyces gossypii]MCT2593709.1 NUDIX hydrolase [Streptomyces gossypii]